jgi:hypothetical protein
MAKETEKERLDRNLIELLNELRVALPGVQVLFAFLLAVPFAQGFERITEFQKAVFFATLAFTALSTAFFIAPSAYHRLLFRHSDKSHVVFIANRLAVIGLGFMALAMTGAMLLVTDFIFDMAFAVVATAFFAVVFATLWYGGPLVRRSQLSGDRDL